MALLIKNGHVIDPVERLDKVLDILIDKGKIVKLSTPQKTGMGIQVIDAGGKIVSPGFVDMHVHLRDPGYPEKETIYTGLKAAVRGGFTSVCCMPNTRPTADSPDIIRYIIDEGKKSGLANLFPVAAITRGLKGTEPTDISALVKSGVVGFSDDGRCVMNARFFYQALKAAKEHQVPVIEHPEDHFLSDNGVVNMGYLSETHGLKGVSPLAEEVIVARDILIQREVQSRLHLTHISTAGAVEMIREAKQKTSGISADATLHHLLLNDELIDINNSVYKVNPPIRTERDRQALLQGVLDGTIDCIASDHAPHTTDEKNRPFNEAPFGMIGMEASFPLFYDRFVKPNILSLNRMIELFSVNPVRLMNLENRGSLKPGHVADITILDLDKPFEIGSGFFDSKSRNCPFMGWKGRGSIAYTIVGGVVKYCGLS